MHSQRILDRLWTAERKESDAWFRQDIRQAWIVVSLAGRGEQQPLIQSSYTIYGLHPDNVWPNIQAIRRAKLGAEYEMWYDEQGCLLPDVGLKKPPEREAEVYPRLSELIGFRAAK